MVFNSIPRLYQLQDLSTNWQPGSGGNENYQLPPPHPALMTDRAKLAKLKQPEMALKCPRCDSSNTKFCYFNNYSLSQPRHFCKTCRRYWTRGGALRNVPIGGGCRRNRRTNKGFRRSKSPVITAQCRHRSSNSISTTASPTPVSTSSCTTDFIPHFAPHEQNQIPYMPSLHHLTNFGTGITGFGGVATGADAELLHVGQFSEPWKMQQFQHFSLAEPQPQFKGFQLVEPPSDFIEQAGGVLKSEGVNLSRNFLGMEGINDDQYWGGNTNFNTWTSDLNIFTPSTTY